MPYRDSPNYGGPVNYSDNAQHFVESPKTLKQQYGGTGTPRPNPIWDPRGGSGGSPEFGNAGSRAEWESDRARGMAAASVQREAYKQNYGDYQNAMGQSNAARGSQGDALAMQREAAMGNQPSRAEILGRSMADQGIQSQMAMAASARGGAMAQAAAMRNAQANQGAYMSNAQNQMAGLRAEEMSNARNAYMQGATGIRGQDLGAANLGLQRTGMETQNELAQRQLNQQNQQFFEGQSNDIYARQLEADTRAAQLGQEDRQYDEGRFDKYVSAGIGALASFGGGLVGLKTGGKFDGSKPLLVGEEGPEIVIPRGPGVVLNAPQTSAILAPSASSGGWSSPDEASKFISTNPQSPDDAMLFGRSNQMPWPEASEPPAWLEEATARDRPKSPKTMADVHAIWSRSPTGPMPMPDGTGPEWWKQGEFASEADKAKASDTKKPDVGASIAKGVAAAGRMLSDDRAKLAQAWDEGHAAATKDVGKLASMPQARLKELSYGNGLAAAVRSAKADAWDEGRGGSVAQVAPLANAARSMAGAPYKYKPEFTPPTQEPGEVNVGPMAQNMAADPVARTAIKRDPDTGLLAIDRDKALKVTMATVAAQQKQLDAMKQKGAR